MGGNTANVGNPLECIHVGEGCDPANTPVTQRSYSCCSDDVLDDLRANIYGLIKSYDLSKTCLGPPRPSQFSIAYVMA